MIIFVPGMNLKEHLQHPVFRVVAAVSEEMKVPAFVIGGFVRDLILKRYSQDIDIVVLGSGIDFAHEVARKLGDHVAVNYFRNFGTAMIHLDDWMIEFVGARKE